MQMRTPSGAGPYPYIEAPDGAVASSLPGEAHLYPPLAPRHTEVHP